MPSIDNDGCNINVFRFSILNADFTLNASVHAVTRRYHDIHITKVNPEVAKRSFILLARWNLIAFLALSVRNPLLNSQRKRNIFLLIKC